MNNNEKNKISPGVLIGFGIALGIVAIILLVMHFTNGVPARSAFSVSVVALVMFSIGTSQKNKKS